MGDDYSFLQEKIKDEAGSPKTLRKKIIRMILLGFIFGIVACLTFCVLEPWIDDLMGQDTKQISIPEDEMAASADEHSEAEEDGQEEAEDQKQQRLLKSLQNTAKDVRPALVTVYGQKDLDDDKESRKTSGVIIADNGSEMLILCHTLWEKVPKETKVAFSDGSQYQATWKMQDNNMGIGICAVSKEKITNDTWIQIENVTLGNSFQIEDGEPGIVMAASSEEEFKVSYGFISLTEEKVNIADGNVTLLRVDVAGAIFNDGILFSQTGDMIGLVKGTDGEEASYITVYSISDIKKEIEFMSNGKGVPYIGIWGAVLPDELKEEGLEAGIYVSGIDTDSPAMAAGIQRGDVITEIEGTAISSMEDYRKILLEKSVQSTITLTGFRKGADDNYVEMKFKVIVGRK